MKREIKTVHHLNTSKDAVWPLISSGLGWENWFPIVARSKIQGAKRELELNNGDTFKEYFITSEAAHLVVYYVYEQKSFPANGITGVIQLSEVSKNKVLLNWSVEMEVGDDDIFRALEEQIKQMYAASVSAIEKLAIENNQKG